jgi:hypothetical protein
MGVGRGIPARRDAMRWDGAGHRRPHGTDKTLKTEERGAPDSAHSCVPAACSGSGVRSEVNREHSV